jgi:hypothetical protein
MFLVSSPRFSRDARYSIVVGWFGFRNRATDAPAATRAVSSTSAVAGDPITAPAFDASHVCASGAPIGGTVDAGGRGDGSDGTLGPVDSIEDGVVAPLPAVQPDAHKAATTMTIPVRSIGQS